MKDKKNNNNINYIYIIAALLVGFLIGKFIPTNSANIASEKIGKVEVQKILNEKLIKNNDVKAEVKNIAQMTGLSKVDVEIKKTKDSTKITDDTIYISNDGKKVFSKIVDFDEVEKAEKAALKKGIVQNKTEKPKVELFVMSYCPFGTQMEKGYLPAIKALGDKIDSKIKFVHYAMHGKKEMDQNTLQYCIQKNNPEKFNDYLTCFLEKGETGIDTCLSENKLSKKDLETCVSETDKKFNISKDFKDKKSYLSGKYPKFEIDSNEAKKYGVQGSPTLVINGQKIEGVARDAKSVLKTICSAFTKQPEECKVDLSDTTPKPGFGVTKEGEANTDGGGCEG